MTSFSRYSLRRRLISLCVLFLWGVEAALVSFDRISQDHALILMTAHQQRNSEVYSILGPERVVTEELQ